MHAIILAGGFGTRLKSVVPDLPKPLAPIGHKPFLSYLFDYLIEQGFTEVSLSLHYQAEKFQHYFQNSYRQLSIRYVIESTPLGTGGAIRYVLSHINETKPIFVINGDTYVQLDYKKMYEQHLKEKASMSIALREVVDCSRFGKVEVLNNRIVQFKEKAARGAGFINAGIYLFDSQIFTPFSLPNCFSIEAEFFYPYLAQLNPLAYISEGYFIDIGIPEDYARFSQLERST